MFTVTLSYQRGKIKQPAFRYCLSAGYFHSLRAGTQSKSMGMRGPLFSYRDKGTNPRKLQPPLGVHSYHKWPTLI